MKLCLLGTSHAAMIIAAHRAEAAGIEMTVFAKPSMHGAEYALDGTVLRATDPDLLTRLDSIGTPPVLDLAQFDAVMVVALAPSVFGAVRMVQGHGVLGWPSGNKLIRKTLRGARPGRQIMTAAAYEAALFELVRASDAHAIARTLAEAGGPPAWIVPQPFPSADLLTAEAQYPIFRRVARQGDAVPVARALSGAFDAAFGPLAGTRVLHQPADTIRDGCFTDPAFMRGAVRLSQGAGQPENDVLHGNAALGKRLLTALRQDCDLSEERRANS